jgi:hypothetical protein
MRAKCFLPAWLFGWVVAIFVPSALIALLGLSEAGAASGTGLDRLPATTWKVADDVGPVAKLMLGAFLLLLFYGVARVRASLPVGTAVAALAALFAMAATLLLVPAAYSRGFGLGLTGSRLDPAILPIYAAGAILAGIVFHIAFVRCNARAAR